MKRLLIVGPLCMMVVLTVIFFTSSLWAVSPEAFYTDKKMRLVVGSAPGGGYDFNARIIARHLGKHIPGKPKIIVQNMPGAGSIIAANYLYGIAKKDGSVIGTIQRGIPNGQLLGLKGVKYDASKFNWLGSISSDVGVSVTWHTSPVKTIQDAMKREVTVGGAGPTSDNVVFPKVLNNTIGTKFNIVYGYRGSAEILLAMERGEVEGYNGWTWASIPQLRPHWLKEKKINILLQVGLARHEDLPNVPLAVELASDEEERQVLKLISGVMGMARPFLAPPGIPQDRAKVLKAAFQATMKDPEFKAEAKKLNVIIRSVSGEQIHKIIDEAFAMPKSVIKRTKAIIGTK
jgi:tripartite-type tricarboxylate transporter receptor subunit TctC